MGKNLREMIFRESVRLWEENGYEAVSMRDIATACGIGTGNLTYYFPKKEDILMYYHDRIMDSVEESVSELETELTGLSGYFAVEYAFMHFIVFHVNELYKQVINVPALRRRYYVQHHKLYQHSTGKKLTRPDWAATVALCNLEFGLTDANILEGEFDPCMEKILETRFIMDARKPSGWKAALQEGMQIGKELARKLEKEPCD